MQANWDEMYVTQMVFSSHANWERKLPDSFGTFQLGE